MLDGRRRSIIISHAVRHVRVMDGNFNPSSTLTAMNFRLTSIIATLGCVLLASCYPYDESKQQKPNQNPKQKTVTTAEQQKIQEQRDQLKAKDEAKKKEEELKNQVVENTGTTTPTNNTPKPPIEDKRTDYAVANKVPGKEGYVFSPYNNKLVDVRDIPSGTLVQDPTYTGAGKGYFRVP